MGDEKCLMKISSATAITTGVCNYCTPRCVYGWNCSCKVYDCNQTAESIAPLHTYLDNSSSHRGGSTWRAQQQHHLPLSRPVMEVGGRLLVLAMDLATNRSLSRRWYWWNWCINLRTDPLNLDAASSISIFFFFKVFWRILSVPSRWY